MRIAFTILFCLPTVARGEWVDVPVRRDSGYGGVFGEIENRLTGPTHFQGRGFAYWPHEDVHILNSQIRRRQMAFYLPGGRACVVPQTGLNVHQIAGVVPESERNTWVYRFYFQGRPPSGMKIVSSGGGGFPGQAAMLNNLALVPFDELSAYTCEAIIMWERGQSGQSKESEFAARCLARYCSLIALHLRSRGYRDWRDLHDFTLKAHEHLNNIARNP